MELLTQKEVINGKQKVIQFTNNYAAMHWNLNNNVLCSTTTEKKKSQESN